MVDRIVYEDNTPEPGDLFTANDAKAIRDAVNALGTAADVDTGTAPGNVPVLNGDGQIPAAMIPGGGGGGGGSGDVTGPGSSTDGRVVLFDGTGGTALKQAAATQVLPVSGTDGYWLTYSTTPQWASVATLIAAIEGAAGMSYTALDDLDTAGAGAKMETALIASGGMTANQAWVSDSAGTGVQGFDLGTAAGYDAIPTGAPSTASSSSGSLALDFTGIAEIQVTTTEAITNITVTVEAYRWVAVTFIQTTARNITWPAGTVISGTGGSLTHTGVANSTTTALIYKRNTTLEVRFGDSAVVGS